jgi:hypothetical protein
MAVQRGMSRSAFAIALLFSSLNGCARGTHEDTPRHNEALIVCPGAKQPRWVKFEGTDQLGYQIEVDYPASSIVSCISGQLKEKGWRPLQEDYWNPGLPSSHLQGWSQFVDATVHPGATVDQWAGQWENDAGDIVFYFLLYKYPPGDRRTLTVNAGFVPANIAKKMPKTPQPQK